MGCEGSGREAQEGRDVYTLTADHAVLQQKPTPHCKAVIFQFKKIKNISRALLLLQNKKSQSRQDRNNYVVPCDRVVAS